jgi:hypothetical protein
MDTFKRNLEQLREKAILHWPDAIISKAGDASILPLLLKTQDDFISILKIASSDPFSWKAILPHSRISGLVFLKHLMVLTDLGGEALNKLTPIVSYFQDGVMRFEWGGKIHKYEFKQIQNKCNLSNSGLNVDSKSLSKEIPLNNKCIDVVMLLMYASQAIDDTLPTEVKDRCIIGSLLGHNEELDYFVKQNYIRVSRQVGGATANAQGQYVEEYVIEKLRQKLPSHWIIENGGVLSGVSKSSSGEGTTFDIIIKSPTKHFAVEVSFQVTTNSTIERKARESDSLKRSVNNAGHFLCYVIDGAGNINIRRRASSILCENSDCTVAMSDSEIAHLADFFISVANEKE